MALPAEPIATALAGCVLRPWHPEDKPALLRNADNRKVWRNLTDLFPHPYTEKHADAWLAHAGDSGRSVHLAIEVDGQAAGGVGAVAGQGVAQATALFGYWLGEAYWGHGIATATATAFAAYLQRERLFARLEAAVFEWNPSSMRVLEKAGFVREGVLRKSVTKDGQLIDSVLYALVL